MSEHGPTAGALYRTVLLAFGLVVGALVFQQLITLFLAVLIVVVIALPLSAFATALQRLHIPRAVGATLGLLIGLAAVGVLIAALVPIFSHEINKFVASLPTITDSARHRLGALMGTSPGRAGQQLQRFADNYTQHPSKLLGPAASVGESITTTLAALIVILLTALYTAIRPDPLATSFLRIFPPGRRDHAAHIIARLRDAYLGWLRGLIVGMIVLGVLTFVGLWLVGLDYAAFFAIFTAVAIIVPYFGALVSSIPPIIYALTVSPGKALVVAVIYIVAHQVEGNAIQPLVVGRSVKLHPAAIAVGVIAVDLLFGFIGMIVAVPILVTIKILVEELWISPMEERAGMADASSAGPRSDDGSGDRSAGPSVGERADGAPPVAEGQTVQQRPNGAVPGPSLAYLRGHRAAESATTAN
jgi:predicted PurR-regulated permease PerM